MKPTHLLNNQKNWPTHLRTVRDPSATSIQEDRFWGWRSIPRQHKLRWACDEHLLVHIVASNWLPQIYGNGASNLRVLGGKLFSSHVGRDLTSNCGSSTSCLLLNTQIQLCWCSCSSCLLGWSTGISRGEHRVKVCQSNSPIRVLDGGFF